MSNAELQIRRIEAVIKYFECVDSGAPSLATLFSDDATIYFPKLGIARGKAEIGVFAQGFATEIREIKHDMAGFNVIPNGEYVVVERQEEGVTRSGGLFRMAFSPRGVSATYSSLRAI